MKIYVVENYDNNEYRAFHTVDAARAYMVKFYNEHYEDWWGRYANEVEPTKSDVIAGIAEDFRGLAANIPYLPDQMICAEVELED